ncbi:hypothetical protein BS47DRAFT_438953 [Hydnum rufescens UP504]|uniref:Uncharacterized protein n=1 Tax=Hydnum rufescens UP504 TaxID=1448309 RepID=A0A9P6B4Z2_9AGAM|nr:hypothetical protein BS47DRAFT_438953 [Hydnum rufescens UP504]
MSDTTLLEIDHKIRTLSSLITKLNQRVETPDFTDHNHISPTLIACNHFATLLTRGIEDGPARTVVAVAGKLSSEVVLAVSVDAHEVLLRSAVNPFPRDQPMFRIDRIAPSPKTLRDLAMPPHYVNEDSLQDYASHLLAAVRDLKTTQDDALFTAFIVRSCLLRITHRLHADLYAFKHPLDEILDGWIPHPGEFLPSKQVHVSLDSDSRTALASILVVGKEHTYEWNINSAPIWVSFLCRLIRNAKRFAGDCYGRNDKNNKTIHSGSLALLCLTLQTLCTLLYKLPIRDLLSLFSIQLKLRVGLRDDCSAVSDEDALDMVIKPNEEIHLFALRHLGNIVAWESAIRYVSRSLQKSTLFRNIVLDFVVTRAVSPEICAPGEPIVNSAIEYALKTLSMARETEDVVSMIRALKSKLLPVQFCGTIHCEASLMGMIIACKGRVPLPDNAMQKKLEAMEKLVTRTGVSTIGVGKKCCWCCSLLAQTLQVEYDDMSFDIPASHGFISPWILPTIGISVPIAESMEAALMDVWIREVVKFVQDHMKSAIPSARSARSFQGSTSDDSDHEDNQLERMANLMKRWVSLDV